MCIRDSFSGFQNKVDQNYKYPNDSGCIKDFSLECPFVKLLVFYYHLEKDGDLSTNKELSEQINKVINYSRNVDVHEEQIDQE